MAALSMMEPPADNPPHDHSAPDHFLGDDGPEDFDPDRLVGCAYWRCGDIFEQRTANHQFCRKACRSRQRKWERSQARKQAKADAKRARMTGQ